MIKLALVMIWIAASFPAAAAEREALGWSVAVTNDVFGRLYRDRWQSSSIQGSVFFGSTDQPTNFGDVLEYRFQSDILTPEHLTNPDPTDRRHAGMLSFGLHTHATRGDVDIRVGGGVVMVGPQTGMLQLQRDVHRILGYPVPALDDFQIANGVFPQISAEIAHVTEGDRWQARPFAEAQIGVEDFVRVGIDLTLGRVARGVHSVRTATTGHRVPVAGKGDRGLSLVAGVDAAWVEDSIFLPNTLGYELTPVRTRIRLGLHYDFGAFDAYYGVARLGEEFEAQREGQTVGVLQLRYGF